MGEPQAELGTLDEMMRLIEENVDRIGVRTQIDGKWQNAILAELPGPLAIKWAFGILRSRRMIFVQRREERASSPSGGLGVAASDEPEG